MPSKSQQGGDLLNDVRNLAIPFSLLIAQKGMEYLANRRTPTPASAKRTSRMRGGAHEGCALCAAQQGGRKQASSGDSSARLTHARVAEEFRQLSSDLQQLLTSYKEHVNFHA